jgi:hypothetical protein
MTADSITAKLAIVRQNLEKLTQVPQTSQAEDAGPDPAPGANG